MITQIGIVAGKILNLLESADEPISLAEINFCVDETAEMIFMSIGWLAREGYIFLEKWEEDYFIKEVNRKPFGNIKLRALGFSLNN